MARSSRLESGFQDRLIDKLKDLFPGCMVFKMDQIQGIPDLLVLYGKKWASLECKRSAGAKRQPNQEYYVEKMNGMVVIISMVLTLAAFFAYCQIKAVAVVWYMVVAAVVLGFMVAYAAMFGFDKLKEALTQLDARR